MADRIVIFYDDPGFFYSLNVCISHHSSHSLGVLGVLAREKMVYFDVAFVSGHAKKISAYCSPSLTDMLCKWIKSS